MSAETQSNHDEVSSSGISKFIFWFKSNYFDSVEFTKVELFMFSFVLLFIPFLWDSSEWILYYAFAVSIGVFVILVIMSKKYNLTSFTPWLEKLSNCKLANDEKIKKYIKEENEYEALTNFFILDPDRRQKLQGKKLTYWDFFGEKPKDDESWWYEVFTEELDYQIYDIVAAIVYPKWIKENYEEGTNLPKADRTEENKKFHNNPELIPYADDSEVTKKLKEAFEEIEKFSKENGVNSTNELNDLFELTKIFDGYWEKGGINKKKIQNLIIEKAITDLWYFAVMVNFRRGIINATDLLYELDKRQEKIESEEISDESGYRNVGGRDIENKIINEILNEVADSDELKTALEDYANEIRISYLPEEVIEKLESITEEKDKIEFFKQLTGSTDEQIDINSILQKIQYNKDWKETIEKIKTRLQKKNSKEIAEEVEKIKQESTLNKIAINEIEPRTALSKEVYEIKMKLAARDNWDRGNWRAMGAIYYRWKEDLLKQQKKSDEELREDENRRKKLDYLESLRESPTVRAADDIRDKFGEKEVGTGKAIIFFGVLFAAIAGVAVTNSIDFLISSMQVEITGDLGGTFLETESEKAFMWDWQAVTDLQYMIYLFVGFFPVALIFYHQGTIFLSAEAAEYFTRGSKVVAFVNFLIMLAEAILLYLLAGSIGDVNGFLSFTIALMALDAIWVVFFTYNDLQDRIRDSPVYLEWIALDLVVIFFALIFMNSAALDPHTSGEDFSYMTHVFPFLLLLIVLIGRTVADYTFGWSNFWALFADVE